ncbi:MAG: hypothetical protein LBG31_03140 [Prevotellaceae bacterium]|jgi:predicted DNA binding CopG/RHH family protein|nr:hypothetical protein [Prevotellaceae bacterium]
MNTVTLQIISPHIFGLLNELQKNNMIKIIAFPEHPTNTNVNVRLSEKYRGAIDRKKGRELLNHIETIRNEWHDTL